MKVVDKPWGRYVIFHADPINWLKRLIINPGEALSLQSHANRDEYWLTHDETVEYQIDDVHGTMKPGLVYTAKAGAKHRLSNTGPEPVVVVEWATGAPDERDIIRYDDNYGRV